MSELVNSPTLHIHIKTSLYFSKSFLPIGFPVSRTQFQCIWTCMYRLPQLNSVEKSDAENFEIVTLAFLR